MIYRISSKQYRAYLKKKKRRCEAPAIYKQISEPGCLICCENWTPWEEVKCMCCDTVPYMECFGCGKITCYKCLEGCLAICGCSAECSNIIAKCPFCRNEHRVRDSQMRDFADQGWIEKLMDRLRY